MCRVPSGEPAEKAGVQQAPVAFSPPPQVQGPHPGPRARQLGLRGPHMMMRGSGTDSPMDLCGSTLAPLR